MVLGWLRNGGWNRIDRWLPVPLPDIFTAEIFFDLVGTKRISYQYTLLIKI